MNKKRALTIAQRRADTTGMRYAVVLIGAIHYTVEPASYLLSERGRRQYPHHATAIPVDPTPTHATTDGA